MIHYLYTLQNGHPVFVPNPSFYCCFKKYMELSVPEPDSCYWSVAHIASQPHSSGFGFNFLKSAKLVTTCPSAFQLPKFCYYYNLSCSLSLLDLHISTIRTRHNNLKHYCLLIRNNGNKKRENPITNVLLEFLEVAKVNVHASVCRLNTQVPKRSF